MYIYIYMYINNDFIDLKQCHSWKNPAIQPRFAVGLFPIDPRRR